MDKQVESDPALKVPVEEPDVNEVWSSLTRPREGEESQVKVKGTGSTSGTGVNEEAVEELAKSVQTLISSFQKVVEVSGGDKTGMASNSNLELLETTRMKLAEEKRSALRAIWKEETRQEVLKRMQFQVQLNECSLRPDDWQHVLKHVKDPGNRAVLSKMSLVWWALVKKDRASFLFDEVFPLLFGKAPLEQFQTVLSCRQVSKDWMFAVDACLQDPDLAAQVDLERKTTGPESKPGDFSLDISLYGEGLEERDQDQEEPMFIGMDPNYFGDNPFITRGLRIENWPENDIISITQFSDEIMALLHVWGRELRQLYIAFPDAPITVAEMYRYYLCPFLRTTPNLRRLAVGATEFWTCMREVMATHPILKDHRVAQPVEMVEVAVAALPELPKLRALRTSLVPREIHQVLLGKYGATLESLCMNCYGGATREHMIQGKMSRLRQFCFITTKEKELELKMSGVDWPVLEEFRSLHYSVIAESIPVIFQNVNLFGRTLRKLMLVLEKGDGPIAKLKYEEIKMLSLELPLVVEFTFYVRGLNLSRIDFILPMASLKELNLYYGKSEKNEAKRRPTSGPKMEPDTNPGPSKEASATSASDPSQEMIQFSSYTNRLYESNIWRLFPDLRMVAINIVTKPKGKFEPFMDFDKTKAKRKIYTREGYGQWGHCNMMS